MIVFNMLNILRLVKIHCIGEVNLETTFDGPRNTYISEDMYSIDPKFGIEIAYKNLAFLRFGGNNTP
mgnify:CR=1 FL=1